MSFSGIIRRSHLSELILHQKKKSNKKVRTVQSIADDWSESDDEVLKVDEAKAKQVSANLVNKIYMKFYGSG